MNMEQRDSESKRKTTINAVSKSFALLELLAKNPKGLQIKEISSEMKFNLSSTYHMVNTLLESGYILKLDNDRFFLGYKIPLLNNAFLQSGMKFMNLSHYLEKLHNSTEETCYLGLEQNDEIYIHKILESPKAVKVNALHVGFTGYAHLRATTKVIMAYWPREKLIAYLKHHPPEKLNEGTVTTTEELIDELSETKSNGYSVDEEAFVKGICCIAAPVFNVDRSVTASYSVSMPAERYWSKRPELIREINRIAREASASLGYTD